MVQQPPLDWESQYHHSRYDLAMARKIIKEREAEISTYKDEMRVHKLRNAQHEIMTDRLEKELKKWRERVQQAEGVYYSLEMMG